MRQLGSLVWKEWREAQAYLWIGLGLFLGLPAVGGLELSWHRAKPFEIDATPWVVALGGVLAVFVAVGVTTRDLRPKLADFWRSRPVGVGRWLAVKFGVALAVVLIACLVPLGVELVLDRQPGATGGLLTFFPVYLAAIFAVAFLAGCVVDRPAHAATVGLAAMLLLYAVPVIVPPLGWMNMGEVADDALGSWGGRQLAFAAVMLVLARVAVGAAVVAVRRGWRVESGRRTMYGLVATAFLLLFASAAFQLATNLPVLQRVELPAGERVQAVVPDGNGGGQIITDTSTPGTQKLPPGYYDPWLTKYWTRPLRVSADHIDVGPPVEIDNGRANEMRSTWREHRADAGFYYWSDRNEVGPRDTVQHFELRVVRRGDETGKAVWTLPLWDEPVRAADQPSTYVWRDTLYVFGQRLQTFALSHGDGRPRRTSDVPIHLTLDHRVTVRDGRLSVSLLPLPGMPAAERLEATLWFTLTSSYYGPTFDGRLLCKWGEDEQRYGKVGEPLVAYRLAKLTDTAATFDRVGEYRPTFLQRWAAGFSSGRLTLGAGRVYVDGLGGGGTFQAGVTILDTGGPRPMRPVGHFAAPGADRIAPLPDGRAIVSGDNHVWLVGPPPDRSGG